MKKKINIFFVSLFCMFLFTNVFSSTKTYERDINNLDLKDSITVTNTVKNAAMSTPKVNEKEKIYDFADLFTDEEEEELYSSVDSYINNYNFDMAIVTIDKNTKKSAMKYADDFYDYNDFGMDSVYSGVLFLIDMDTREIWMSTTGNAIKMYTDYRIDKILDSCYTKISSKKYYSCANKFIEECDKFASKGYPSSNEKNDVQFQVFPVIGISAFIALIISTIFISIQKAKHTTIQKATGAKQYLVKNSFQLTNKTEHFLRTITNKYYSPQSSSGGGHGSSTHHGSSGISHGGGGRHF